MGRKFGIPCSLEGVVEECVGEDSYPLCPPMGRAVIRGGLLPPTPTPEGCFVATTPSAWIQPFPVGSRTDTLPRTTGSPKLKTSPNIPCKKPRPTNCLGAMLDLILELQTVPDPYLGFAGGSFSR